MLEKIILKEPIYLCLLSIILNDCLNGKMKLEEARFHINDPLFYFWGGGQIAVMVLLMYCIKIDSYFLFVIQLVPSCKNTGNNKPAF